MKLNFYTINQSEYNNKCKKSNFMVTINFMVSPLKKTQIKNYCL